MHFKVTLALQSLQSFLQSKIFVALCTSHFTWLPSFFHRMPNTFSKLVGQGGPGTSASAQAKMILDELIVRYSKNRTAIKRLVIAALLASTVNQIRNTIKKAKRARPASKDPKLKDKVEVSIIKSASA
jgi:hypothetical protein